MTRELDSSKYDVVVKNNGTTYYKLKKRSGLVAVHAIPLSSMTFKGPFPDNTFELIAVDRGRGDDPLCEIKHAKTYLDDLTSWIGRRWHWDECKARQKYWHCENLHVVGLNESKTKPSNVI